MKLEAVGLTKAFGEQVVIKNVTFSVKSYETLAIVGRSGCGKTTLLRLLTGLLTPDTGQVLMDGQPAGAPDCERLMVFQSFDQLFPWFTVRRNLQYALQKTRPSLGRTTIRLLCDQCLEELGLQEAGDKYPYQLSGGMKQRGALARAMAISPKVLLLDEPFSSLDVYSRESARQAIATLIRKTGAAVVIVTHDLNEAVALGSNIALMRSDQRGIVAMLENRGADVLAQMESLLKD